MWSAGDGDDNRRFLADLRALRDRAALEFDELAARAHYPSDVLKEAENGPSLPSLPILAAYVRACDADVPDWEERWRRLGFESRADPGLPVRPAGASPAAVAGARAGVGVAPPESYDAERIRAVLRSAHGSSDRGARGTASRGTASTAPASAAPVSAAPWGAVGDRDGSGTATAEQRVPEGPANWDPRTTTRWDADRDTGFQQDIGFQRDTGYQRDGGFQRDAGTTLGMSTSWDGFQPDAGPGWDGAAADPSGAPANGKHHVSEPVDWPSDNMVIETPDVAQADAIRRDPFSAAWLQDSELTSPPGLEAGWQGQAEAGPAPAAPENWFLPRETETWSSADTQPSPAVADTWFAPRERSDNGLPPERDMAPPAESAAPVTGFWTPSTAAPAQAEVRRPDPAQAEGHTMPGTMAGPAVPPGPVLPQTERRADRLHPARLLAVIVVAALIGSILVLLLR
jgi:hypothetical protein